MTLLSCSAKNCVNYINGVCTAMTIEVNGEKAENRTETSCITFAPRNFANAIKNVFNTNYAGTIMQAIDSDNEIDHKIRCYAINCKYNKDMSCLSRDIQIFGPEASTSESTDCETFQKR